MIFAPSVSRSFVLDTDLCCGFVLQQALCGPPQDTEIGIAVNFSWTTLVFAKRHVRLPVQIILYASEPPPHSQCRSQITSGTECNTEPPCVPLAVCDIVQRSDPAEQKLFKHCRS